MWRIVSLRGSNVHTWQAGAVELGLVKITEKPPSIFPVLAESGGPFVYPTAFNEAKGGTLSLRLRCRFFFHSSTDYHDH